MQRLVNASVSALKNSQSSSGVSIVHSHVPPSSPAVSIDSRSGKQIFTSHLVNDDSSSGLSILSGRPFDGNSNKSVSGPTASMMSYHDSQYAVGRRRESPSSYNGT